MVVAQPLNIYTKFNDMQTSQSNNGEDKLENKPVVPTPHEDTEQHLEFTGPGKEVPESDVVNQPEHHITKEEFKQRESGQASGASIPPPDDAPRGL